MPTPESEEEDMEPLNPIQQLVQDLAENRPVAESVEDITSAAAGNPLITAQIRMMMKISNDRVWESLAMLGVPAEVLAGIEWRETWLNQLRTELERAGF